MAYEPINWVNTATPLNARNLNHMEEGISEADIKAETIAAFEALGWESVDENVASAILEFIGSLIGADPETLSTTAKTLVGAINEDHARIRDIYASTTDPTDDQGSDGDIWLVYNE